MDGRYDHDGWTYTDRPSSALPALGSAATFFVVASVNAAIWVPGNLSLWHFVLAGAVVGALVGAFAVFIGVFLVCKAVV